MDPREFIGTAKHLLEKSGAANCRTAFSRSYYAAYNVGVELLEGAGIRIKKTSMGHEEVSVYLNQCGINELAETQSKLGNLRTKRIKADYRLDDRGVESIKNAGHAIKRSEQIIRTLDSYSSNSWKKKIAEGVETYNNKIRSASKASKSP